MPGIAFGALTWETQRISRSAQPGETEIVAEFKFRNTGSTPVTIRDLKTSCECTAADLAKRTYAPGEGGTIKAVFTPGDRMGPQEKQVSLITDDPTAPIVTLILQLNLPERITFSPRLLRWTMGAPATEKSIDLTVAGQNRILSLGVKSIAPQDSAVARFETVVPGVQYRIFLKPADTDQMRNITVNILTTFEGSSRHSFEIYALVR